MKPLHCLALLTAAFLFSQFMAVKLAFADECTDDKAVQALITTQVPDARFVSLTADQTKVLLSLINGEGSSQTITADAITIGYSDGKANVLIILFKGGCASEYTYMPKEKFLKAMSSI